MATKEGQREMVQRRMIIDECCGRSLHVHGIFRQRLITIAAIVFRSRLHSCMRVSFFADINVTKIPGAGHHKTVPSIQRSLAAKCNTVMLRDVGVR